MHSLSRSFSFPVVFNVLTFHVPSLSELTLRIFSSPISVMFQSKCPSVSETSGTNRPHCRWFRWVPSYCLVEVARLVLSLVARGVVPAPGVLAVPLPLVICCRVIFIICFLRVETGSIERYVMIWWWYSVRGVELTLSPFRCMLADGMWNVLGERLVARWMELLRRRVRSALWIRLRVIYYQTSALTLYGLVYTRVLYSRQKERQTSRSGYILRLSPLLAADAKKTRCLLIEGGTPAFWRFVIPSLALWPW